MILVLNSSDINGEEQILQVIKSNCNSYCVKSRNMTKCTLDLVVEIRTEHPTLLINEVNKIDFITSVSLIKNNGDTIF